MYGTMAPKRLFRGFLQHLALFLELYGRKMYRPLLQANPPINTLFPLKLSCLEAPLIQISSYCILADATLKSLMIFLIKLPESLIISSSSQNTA